MHPVGHCRKPPPARVVESGAAGRAVSAMLEETWRQRHANLRNPLPPTGAFQGTLHPPPTQRLAAPGQVIPKLDGNTAPCSNDFELSPGAFAVCL